MATSRQFDTEAWYDPMTDSICVRVRRIYSKGKKGIVVRIAEEALVALSEGHTYPILNDPKQVRWMLINDDID